MINPKASQWPVSFCIIWILSPFQPHLLPVTPCFPVSAIMVFCLFPKRAMLIPPRKTWHLLLSTPGIIFSQALSPEWIQIFSDTTSLNLGGNGHCSKLDLSLPARNWVGLALLDFWAELLSVCKNECYSFNSSSGSYPSGNEFHWFAYSFIH